MNKEQWEQEVLRFEAEYEDDSPFDENWNGYFTDVISRNREFPIDLRPSPGKRMREVTCMEALSAACLIQLSD